MNVSVIVPVRNAAHLINRCVEALLTQSYSQGEVEVLVIDDGSMDRSAEIAREAGADVLTISPSGPAVARNHGAAVARGEILLFTDGDCIPARDWIESMVQPFEDDAVTATKGIYRTDQQSLTARFVQFEYESRYRRMQGYDSIDFIDTYAAGFRKDQFERAGGFDGSYPDASVEDQEFSFRYARLGGRMVFCPAAVVTHRHVDNPYRYMRKKLKIGFWKVRVMRRHPDKIISDAHTPPTVKIEMLSALLLLGSAPFMLTTPGMIVLSMAMAIFLASASPLVIGILRRDIAVGLMAPLLLLLRGMALGLGSLIGGFAVLGDVFRGRQKPTSSSPGASEDQPREDDIDGVEAVQEEAHELA